ncbi:hypothetical protein [Amycolatopsis sp. YIM 10]|uniref:hypothetical protein n=1 Tax=Amycolatopsis sp. YIM 10 TaxID=2653857 RepID=UPI0012900368|nr:hypothetical protein [Amycolatopsis sp. YIM 10]QFU90935.1 hypothetical protein YIM_28815 [Amycolatopsis sp. YIM 10]
MTDASPRLCNKCGTEPTEDQKIGILCRGCRAMIEASDPLGGRIGQRADSAS